MPIAVDKICNNDKVREFVAVNGLVIDEETEQPTMAMGQKEVRNEEVDTNKNQQMPRAIVMINLILTMVWRNLIRNPNTYASILGLIWSLIFFRYFFHFFLTMFLSVFPQKKKTIVNSIIISIIQSLFHVRRWNIKMPSIIKGSIEIISNTGLGIVMFSLGTYFLPTLFSIFCQQIWVHLIIMPSIFV